MRTKSMDTLSQFSIDSSTSADSKDPVYIAAVTLERDSPKVLPFLKQVLR